MFKNMFKNMLATKTNCNHFPFLRKYEMASALTRWFKSIELGRCDLGSLNSVVAVYSGEVTFEFL